MNTGFIIFERKSPPDDKFEILGILEISGQIQMSFLKKLAPFYEKHSLTYHTSQINLYNTKKITQYISEVE
jgi:hypothetical protein